MYENLVDTSIIHMFNIEVTHLGVEHIYCSVLCEYQICINELCLVELNKMNDTVSHIQV